MTPDRPTPLTDATVFEVPGYDEVVEGDFARELERENARLRRAVSALYEWYDKDGSVGMASVVFEEHRSALRDTEAK